MFSRLFSVVGFLLPLHFVFFPAVHFLSLADRKSDNSEYPSPIQPKLISTFPSGWFSILVSPFFFIIEEEHQIKEEKKKRKASKKKKNSPKEEHKTEAV